MRPELIPPVKHTWSGSFITPNSTSATLRINKMFREVVYMFRCLNMHVLAGGITPARPQHPLAGASKATVHQILPLIWKANISSIMASITVWRRCVPTASLPQRRVQVSTNSHLHQRKPKTSPRCSDKYTELVYVFEDKSCDYGCHMWGKQSI